MAPRRRVRRRQEDDDRNNGGIGSAIDKIIKEMEATSGKGPKPIGVGRDYVATTQKRYTPQGQYPRVLNMPPIPGYANLPAEQKPRYFEDDQFAPANMDSGIIADLQQQLAFIGFYETNDEIIPGDWGPDTAKAFKKLLAYANQHGMSYRQALNNIRSQVSGGAGGGTEGAGGGRYRVDEFGNIVPLDAAPERAPLVARTTDPKTLELVFRETAMQLTGQALSPDQISAMSSAYNEMEIQRQQEAYDKELTGGTVVDIPSPQSFSQSQVEQQFPEATQDYRALTYLSDAMQMLASPAWGLR